MEGRMSGAPGTNMLVILGFMRFVPTLTRAEISHLKVTAYACLWDNIAG